jgi:dTMP kinase
MPGKLIVFEGTDGSGKSTQFSLLCKALEQEGKSCQRLVFPQYSEPSSALIRMYLGGEFGDKPSDVNAYAASAFYAVDRYASFKKVWGQYYEDGGLILSDRYTTSNAIHQASKVAGEDRKEFYRWLTDFEYGKLGLPAPDIVFWFDMPIEQAVANLRSREASTHTSADIHEVDTAYLETCYQTAKEAASEYGWQRIACLDENGVLRSPEEIHREVLSFV